MKSIIKGLLFFFMSVASLTAYAYSDTSGSLIPSDVDHYSEGSGSVIPNDVDRS